MDFAGLGVTELTLPIKRHIKKIQIEQKNDFFFFLFHNSSDLFFHCIKTDTVNSFFFLKTHLALCYGSFSKTYFSIEGFSYIHVLSESRVIFSPGKR